MFVVEMRVADSYVANNYVHLPPLKFFHLSIRNTNKIQKRFG
jgi:hypothetical protein